jgi:large subunit ribosomal protein L21e
MATSGRGFRSGTRRTFKKEKRSKFTVEKLMKEFRKGDKVVVKQDPSSQDSMPHSRYRGKIGMIEGKRGRAYVVSVKLGNAKKQVITRPEHLKQHEK